MAQPWLSKRTRSRFIWGALSVAAHLGVLAAVLSVGPEPIRRFEPEPIPVELVAPRIVPPPKPPAPEPTPEPAAAQPPPKLKARKPRPAPPEVAPLRAAPGPTTQPGEGLTDAEVAGAATAGSGGGGGCNMAQWLQQKLRQDAQVQAAMAAVPRGKPVLVWRGDWIKHGGEEGEGLAKVREVIMWEVGFAPEACRREPVHGLVLLSLADSPGAPRLVLGAASWRWTDLLFARSSPRARG